MSARYPATAASRAPLPPAFEPDEDIAQIELASPLRRRPRSRAVVVHDDAAAREALARLVRSDSQTKVAAVLPLDSETPAMVERLRPDLLIVGGDLPAAARADLVTAARRGFPGTVTLMAGGEPPLGPERNEILLIRPLTVERIQEVLGAARFTVQHAQRALRLARESSSEAGAAPRLRRWVVRRRGSVRFYDVGRADWIEAVQNYVRVHAGEASWLVRQQIGPLETLLDPDRFFRLHRSYIVNLDRVQELEHSRRSGWSIVLEGDVRIPCGRAYRPRLEELLTGFR